MTTTFTWKIDNLKRESSDGYVYSIDYSITGNDGINKNSISGSVDLDKPDTLVPFKDLTESVCLKWVKDKITADSSKEIDIDSTVITGVGKGKSSTPAEMETRIKETLNVQAKPLKIDGIPWS